MASDPPTQYQVIDDGIRPYGDTDFAKTETPDELYTARRPLEVSTTNSDLAGAIKEIDRHVSEIYEAIRRAPIHCDIVQRAKIDEFRTRVAKNPDDRELEMAQVALAIFQKVRELHLVGDHLRPYQLAELDLTQGDRTMSLFERLEFVKTILRRSKSLCSKAYTGMDAIMQLVAAPEACENREHREGGIPHARTRTDGPPIAHLRTIDGMKRWRV